MKTFYKVTTKERGTMMMCSNVIHEDFFGFCKNFIIDEIDKHVGREFYGADLGIELTERMLCNGSFTYSTTDALNYLIKWFAEAAEFFDYEKFNFGEMSNPFSNVELFLATMVAMGVDIILSRCELIRKNGDVKFELTEELIALIKEQVEEQANDELFYAARRRSGNV